MASNNKMGLAKNTPEKSNGSACGDLDASVFSNSFTTRCNDLAFDIMKSVSQLASRFLFSGMRISPGLVGPRRLKSGLNIYRLCPLPHNHRAGYNSIMSFRSTWPAVLSLRTGKTKEVATKGAWRDTVFVERLWWTIKYEEVYLRAYRSVSEARRGLDRYVAFYNRRRPHSLLGGQTPDQAYFNQPTPIPAAA